MQNSEEAQSSRTDCKEESSAPLRMGTVWGQYGKGLKYLHCVVSGELWEAFEGGEQSVYKDGLASLDEWVKSLLCKHKGLSSNPQYSCKKLSAVAEPVISVLERQR